MSRWRRLAVDGRTYRWRGSSYAVVQDDAGQRVLSASAVEIKGADWCAWERGQQKRTQDGMLLPREVVSAIRERVGNGGKDSVVAREKVRSRGRTRAPEVLG